MAKSILKNTQIAAVVKCYGAATDTITLGTDLLRTGQVASTPKANIAGIQWAIPAAGTATITRNAVVLYTLGPGWGVLSFDGFADSDQNTSDIVVTTTGAATVILDLFKVSGYGDEQHENFNDPS